MNSFNMFLDPPLFRGPERTPFLGAENRPGMRLGMGPDT